MSNERLNRTQVALAFAERLIETDDLVELHIDGSTDGALLLLADGVTLKGLAAFQFGDQDVTDSATYASLAVLVRVADGMTATIAHESGAMDAAHRIHAIGGLSLEITSDDLVVLIYSREVSRWIAVSMRGQQGPEGDQGPQGIQGIQGTQGPAGPDSYSPANSSHWSGTPPSTMTAAINRLAAYANQGSLLALLGVSKP